MGYEEHTKNAYRNEEKAQEYLDQYIKGTKWARVTMWRQKSIIKRFIEICNLTDRDSILDIPCGTGYIGGILSETRASVYASDISMEMMRLATDEYYTDKFMGFVQADITEIPFPNNAFETVVILALMHRLDDDLRRLVLDEVFRVSNRSIIISYSLENLLQRLKRRLLLKIKKNHIPAPVSTSFDQIKSELTNAGFKIAKIKHIIPFFSAKIVLLVHKN